MKAGIKGELEGNRNGVLLTLGEFGGKTGGCKNQVKGENWD